jgi:hypothetical protein
MTLKSQSIQQRMAPTVGSGLKKKGYGYFLEILIEIQNKGHQVNGSIYD